jgi:hypothetical protein
MIVITRSSNLESFYSYQICCLSSSCYRLEKIALNVLAFLSARLNPAAVNLLVLPPTICRVSPKNHSTVAVIMVGGLMLSPFIIDNNSKAIWDKGSSLDRLLHYSLLTFRGDALFGASFSLEQKEAPPPP